MPGWTLDLFCVSVVAYVAVSVWVVGGLVGRIDRLERKSDALERRQGESDREDG